MRHRVTLGSARKERNYSRAVDFSDDFHCRLRKQGMSFKRLELRGARRTIDYRHVTWNPASRAEIQV